MGRSIDEDAAINIVKYECEEWGDWGVLAGTIIERIRQLPPTQSDLQQKRIMEVSMDENYTRR